jgi:hypothetical protein
LCRRDKWLCKLSQPEFQRWWYIRTSTARLSRPLESSTERVGASTITELGMALNAATTREMLSDKRIASTQVSCLQDIKSQCKWVDIQAQRCNENSFSKCHFRNGRKPSQIFRKLLSASQHILYSSITCSRSKPKHHAPTLLHQTDSILQNFRTIAPQNPYKSTGPINKQAAASH